MAKKTQKTVKKAAAPPNATSTSGKGQVPPTQLMDLVESFLSDQGFDNAHREFQKHRAKKGWKAQGTKKNKDKAHNSLVSVFQTWETFSSQANTPILVKEDPMEKATKVSSSSSESDSSDDSSSESESDNPEDVAMADAPAADDSSSSESSDSSDSDSDSESESDEEDAKPAKSATGISKTSNNPLKRKAESESESSDSDSDEDTSDSSSEDKRPQNKKAKPSDSSDESSDESSSSESSESSGDESSSDEGDGNAKSKGTSKSEAEDNESSSSSDSDSESEEEPKIDLKVAAEVPLPESDSSSDDSDSESESESETEKKPQPKAKGGALNGTGSDTSVTLDQVEPEYAPLPPDPSTLKTNNRGKNGAKTPKTQNQPFSRIRQNMAIDPRLSSNAYVSHGYGEKAHQDLIVTKGKGFTKEKNKKKRGSYKGGPLDIHNSRSIKFDD